MIILLLALFLVLPSPVLADMMRVDVDLTWNIGALSPIQFSGTGYWQPGVGYLPGSAWALPDMSALDGAPSHWTNMQGPTVASLYFLDDGNDHIVGTPRPDLHAITVPITPAPGVYAISDGMFTMISHNGGTTNFTGFSAVSGSISVSTDAPIVVSAPELAVLRPWVRHLGGRQLAAALNPTLQRITAWGVAKLLGAPSSGVWVFLPTTYLEVQEWCSGLVTMKWLLVLGVVCVMIGRAGWPWSLAVLAMVPLIAMEVNILRVAGIGLGYGHDGWASWGAIGLGVAQVAGFSYLSRRVK